MLTIGIQYLTGYAVATDTGNRHRAEWPPHPGRVFMAMAAAYFETQPTPNEANAVATWEAEGAALRWLEQQGAPHIQAPDADRRDVLDVYVPPNDMGPSKITVVPMFRSNRQPRTFPKVRPIDDTLYLYWPETDGFETHQEALSRLCRKVIRIGHSSSLVRMWLAEPDEQIQANFIPVATREAGMGAERLRIVGSGCVDYLKQQYNGQAVEEFYHFWVRINTSEGKAQKAAKAEYEQRFGQTWKRSSSAPKSQRPKLSLTQPYRRVDSLANSEAPVSSVFDDTLLVLDKREGPALGLEATWRILTAMRGVIETRCEPTPEWVNGHKETRAPSESPHLALMPLAFVGNEYADGHLMGIALAFPRQVSQENRGALLGRLLYDARGQERPICLKLGQLGTWTLCQEERTAPPTALRTETWTGPSKVWASVSPVVLDRHPKSDPLKARLDYIKEVQTIIGESCTRIDIPEPVEIDIDKTSWHRGAPRAKPGPDGFPLMPVRPGGPNRRQVHVWLRFDKPVLGPVLLGSGRYRGYGLCKPFNQTLED